MISEEAFDEIVESDVEMLSADGFEAALIGVVTGRAGMHVLCYDRDKCIQILMERDGMDWETAEEFFEFNVAGAYAGEGAPVYLERIEGKNGSDG